MGVKLSRPVLHTDVCWPLDTRQCNGRRDVYRTVRFTSLVQGALHSRPTVQNEELEHGSSPDTMVLLDVGIRVCVP